MKKLFTREFVIGLSVILAIVVLYVGIDYLKGVNIFKPANFYVAEYKNVAGLELSAPVTVDGFKVGQVREINFNYANPGDIEVVLALNKELRIPEDSKAVIGSGLLNGAYVEIKLGQSKKMIEVGGNIATETVPDMMASLSDELLPSVQSILPKVDSLVLNLNRLVSDPALATSIQSLEGITHNLYQATGSLNGIMGRDVPVMLRNTGRAMSNIDTITRNLNVLSTQLKSLPLASTMDNVEDITGNLSKFSRQLNNENSSFGRIMNDPELYERINKVTSDIDSLIIDIQKNPKRYISIKLL
ncbi:MAG: MlaD family protein [Muribaculaceae bacterium]|nr:MlaD family protein [Muribaculaceae bacterium]MDE6532773.1 MlaD family protein [Muribaculaceae bacterium]